MNHTIPLAIALVTVCARGATQEPPRGILSPTAFGLQIAPQFAPNPSTLQFKSNGEGVPIAPYAPNPQQPIPDYSKSAMFGGAAGVVEIDGFSTGNDIIPINALGEVAPNERWSMLAFSVDKDATGQAGSWIKTMASQPEGPGAEIMGFYFEDSEMIPPQMWNNVYLEHSIYDVSNGPAGVPTEINGFDVFMPLIVGNQGAPDPLFPFVDSFYFTVTSASAVLLENEPEFAAIGTITGGTIMAVAWDGSSWSDPFLAASHTDLGLLETEDVDALAVQPTLVSGPQQHTIVFSTKHNAATPRPQLMVMLSPGVVPPLELKNPDGTSIPPRIGAANTDEIDGICGVDPEINERSHWVGSPIGWQPPTTPILGIGVGREVDPPPQFVEYVMHASGWGAGAPEPGTMVFVYELVGDGLLPSNPPEIAPIFRTVHDDVVETRLLLPVPSIAGSLTMRVRAGFLPASGHPPTLSPFCEILY